MTSGDNLWWRHAECNNTLYRTWLYRNFTDVCVSVPRYDHILILDVHRIRLTTTDPFQFCPAKYIWGYYMYCRYDEHQPNYRYQPTLQYMKTQEAYCDYMNNSLDNPLHNFSPDSTAEAQIYIAFENAAYSCAIQIKYSLPKKRT